MVNMTPAENFEGPKPYNITPQGKVGLVGDQSTTDSPQSVLDFIYKNVENKCTSPIKLKDSALSMKDLRHWVPLAMMHVYGKAQDTPHRKLKGLWTEKPSCWPEDLAFADPNNGKTRPKKEVLIRMAEFLFQKLLDAAGAEIHQEVGDEIMGEVLPPTVAMETHMQESDSHEDSPLWENLLDCMARCEKMLCDKATCSLQEETRDHLLFILDSCCRCRRSEVQHCCKLAHGIEAVLDGAIILGEITEDGQAELAAFINNNLLPGTHKPALAEVTPSTSYAVPLLGVSVQDKELVNLPIASTQQPRLLSDPSTLKKDIDLGSLRVDGVRPYETSVCYSSSDFTGGPTQDYWCLTPGPEAPPNVQLVSTDMSPGPPGHQSAAHREQQQYQTLQPCVMPVNNGSDSQWGNDDSSCVALQNIRLGENNAEPYDGVGESASSVSGVPGLASDTCVGMKEESCPDVGHEVEVVSAMEEVDTPIDSQLDPQYNGNVQLPFIPIVVADQESSDGDSEISGMASDEQWPPRKRRRHMMDLS